MEVSLECDEIQIKYFQNLIGVLRWIVQLDRIDVAYEVSSLLKFLAHPRTSHIYEALHILKYLETHINNNLAFNPINLKTTSICNAEALIHKMRQIYVDVVEDLPSNTLPP